MPSPPTTTHADAPYKLAAGTTFTGTDISSTASRTVAQCANACTNANGCVMFLMTYSGSATTGTCVLRSATTFTSQAASATTDAYLALPGMSLAPSYIPPAAPAYLNYSGNEMLLANKTNGSAMGAWLNKGYGGAPYDMGPSVGANGSATVQYDKGRAHVLLDRAAMANGGYITWSFEDVGASSGGWTILIMFRGPPTAPYASDEQLSMFSNWGGASIEFTRAGNTSNVNYKVAFAVDPAVSAANNVFDGSTWQTLVVTNTINSYAFYLNGSLINSTVVKDRLFGARQNFRNFIGESAQTGYLEVRQFTAWLQPLSPAQVPIMTAEQLALWYPLSAVSPPPTSPPPPPPPTPPPPTSPPPAPSPPSPPPAPNAGQPPVTSGLWAYMHGGTFDASAKQWLDISGNNNHANVTRGTVTTASETRGNASVWYVRGTKNDGIKYLTMAFNMSNYTLFHITRWAAQIKINK